MVDEVPRGLAGFSDGPVPLLKAPRFRLRDHRLAAPLFLEPPKIGAWRSRLRHGARISAGVDQPLRVLDR